METQAGHAAAHKDHVLAMTGKSLTRSSQVSPASDVPAGPGPHYIASVSIRVRLMWSDS